MNAWLRNLPVRYRFVCAAVLAGAVWITTRLLPLERVLQAQAGAGYWLILAAFAIWVWALARLLPSAWRALRWQPIDRWGLAAVLVCSGLLLVHEGRGFKAPAIELEWLGTSMAMHWQRGVFLPGQGGEVNGVFELLAGSANVRPLFFPFLLSVLHDIAGYRPENAFVLNGALTLLLLGLSYLAGRALAGWKGGLLAVLAWTALPLLAQSAAGGGADLLNVVMLLATALLAGWHLHARDDASLTALVFSGVLLAQTQSGSSVFLLGVAVTSALVWKEQRAAHLPWLVVLSPFFLIPFALLRRIMDSVPDTSSFSSDHLRAHLGQALVRWFDSGPGQPNAPLVSALGLASLAIMLVLLPRTLRHWSGQTTAGKATVIFSGAVLLHFALILGSAREQGNDSVFPGPSLPMHLLFALTPVLVLARLPRLRHSLGIALALVGLSVIASSLPEMTRQTATRLHAPALDAAWRREFASLHSEPDYLVIDRESRLWLTHRIASQPVEQARNHPETIAALLEDRQVSAVYVFQHFSPGPEPGVLSVRPEDDLGPAYTLEMVGERTFQLDRLSRISRIVAIAPSRENSSTSTTTKPAREQPPDARLEDWITTLP